MNENQTQSNEKAIVIRPAALAVPAWIEARDTALQAAAALTSVETDLDFDKAGQLINSMAHLAKNLEAARKAVTAPLDKAKKEIMAQEKAYVDGMAAEQGRLRALANAYASRKAAEREAAERAAREAAAERAAMEAEARAAFGGEAVPVSQQPVELVAEAVSRPLSSAVRQVTVYNYDIVDASKLDRKFLSVDAAKIRDFCNYLKKMDIDPSTVEEPGLIIRKEVRVDSK